MVESKGSKFTFPLALQLLTVFRLPVNTMVDSESLANSMAWFPVVGLLIGLVLAGIWYFLSPFLHPLFVSLLVVVSLTVITRGLHLDGLSDTIDGLGGGYTREKRLEIMKDSHIGAFGVIAIVFAILFKVIAIYEIPQNVRLSVLIFFPILSRFVMVLVAWKCPYARREGGLGQDYVDLLKTRTLIIAFITTLLLGLLILSYTGLILAIIIMGVAFGFSVFFNKTLGGVTGDVLGATNEVCEILALSLSLVLPFH